MFYYFAPFVYIRVDDCDGDSSDFDVQEDYGGNKDTIADIIIRIDFDLLRVLSYILRL